MNKISVDREDFDQSTLQSSKGVERFSSLEVGDLSEAYKLFGLDIGLLFDRIAEFFLAKGEDQISQLFRRKDSSVQGIQIEDPELREALCEGLVKRNAQLSIQGAQELADSLEEEEMREWLRRVFGSDESLVFALKTTKKLSQVARKALLLAQLKNTPIVVQYKERIAIVDHLLSEQEILELLEGKLKKSPRRARSMLSGDLLNLMR